MTLDPATIESGVETFTQLGLPTIQFVIDTDNWVPAYLEISGAQVFILGRGNGNGRGRVHKNWTVEDLLMRHHTWVRLLCRADSDREMAEGTHYERLVVNDGTREPWHPTQVKFSFNGPEQEAILDFQKIKTFEF